MGFVIIGSIICLVGGALIETSITVAEFSFWRVLFGVFCGAPFLIFGGMLLISGIKDIRSKTKEEREKELADIKEAFKPGFKEANTNDPFRKFLKSFREHYSSFFASPRTLENEPIQNEVTQIYRNMMDFRQNRLKRLGITLELTAKSMTYFRQNGLAKFDRFDGKYEVTEVEEEIAARTIYKKGGKVIYHKDDREVANYTIVSAKQVGKNVLVCPNCGAEMTREQLLDGCDYCGTKFTVEDLDHRIAEFAFRSDANVAESKYKAMRNQGLRYLSAIIVGVAILAFIALLIFYVPTFMEETGGGFMLTLLATLFATAVTAAVLVPAVFIVYSSVIIPVGMAIFGMDAVSRKLIRKLKDAPSYDISFASRIRKHDENFSIRNYYSGVQNKISSVIFADNEKQINAFAVGNLNNMLGKYSNVIGVDVEYMSITDYTNDKAMQHSDTWVWLKLTELKGRKCRIRREKWAVKLAKSAACKTQVACAPSILKCQGCGTSLDLLKGKACPACGREVSLVDYDWVIEKIRVE